MGEEEENEEKEEEEKEEEEEVEGRADRRIREGKKLDERVKKD